MTQITKPLFLDETGQQILQALRDIATRTNVDPKELESIKDRVTALEGGKGMLYIYKALKDEILFMYDPGVTGEYYIEVNGERIELDDAFFNSCLYLDFGGTTNESGVYVYPYEGTLTLSVLENIEIAVNGDVDWVNMEYYATFIAPQDAHVTLA